jgi:hypothetical protein
MNWFLAALFYIFIIEVALRLPFASVLRRLVSTSSKAVHVIQADAISDHWKEKAMSAYAKSTFVSSLFIGLLLAFLLAIATLLTLTTEYFSSGFQEFILSWIGILFGLGFSVVYVIIKKSLI